MPKPPEESSRLAAALTFQFGRRGARLRAQRARYPDEPWRWREDWETGVIPASREGGAFGAWLLALVFLGVGVAVFVLAFGDLTKGREPLLWLFVLFPLAGVLFAIRACVLTARSVRYGRPVLRLAETPCVLGGTVRGTVEFHGARAPRSEAAEIELQERHLVQKRTSSRSTETEIRVVWSLRIPMVLRGGESTIPVSLPIPSDGEEADAVNPGGVSWRVRIRAATAGADLDVAFDLPVFAGEGGDPAQTKKAIETAAAQSTLAAGEDAMIQTLRNEGIRLQRHPAGLELRVRPLGLRRLGFGFTALVFVAIPVLFWRFVLSAKPSFGRWLGFALLTALGVLVGSLTLTKSFRVRAGGKGLRITRHILGIPSVWQVPYEAIESIQAKSTMSSSGAQGTVNYYDLIIKWQARGKSREASLALGVTDKALAMALAEALRHASTSKP